MAAFLAILKLIQALAPVFALAAIGVYGARQKTAGAQLEAAKVEHVTATAEAAIAQAEADAPTTPLAVVDRLNAGSF